MINSVVGIAKIYETYVGVKSFQNVNDLTLNKLQEIGQEIGATTGRKRQTNYLNLPFLVEAIKINQVSTVIINKCDILEQVGIYTLINGVYVNFKTLDEMKNYIIEKLKNNFPDLKIIFSSSPYDI
jgi:adenylosuccinate synthase